MKAAKISPFTGLIKSLENGFQQKLLDKYDIDKVTMFITHAKESFKSISPLIPEVDEKSPWLKNIIAVAYEIGIWLQLEKSGMAIPEISELTCEVLSDVMRQIPLAIRKGMKTASLSKSFVSEFAKESENLNHNNNWNVSLVCPKASDSFEIGINIYTCPIVRMCETLGVRRFAPYFCKNDFVTYNVLGIQLSRTQTLADGDVMCDFRLSDITN